MQVRAAAHEAAGDPADQESDRQDQQLRGLRVDEGVVDRIEQTADIAAHRRQSANRQDRDETKNNAVLDHALALFVANKLLDELHHDEKSFSHVRVECEPEAMLVDSDRAWSEPPPGGVGVSRRREPFGDQPP